MRFTRTSGSVGAPGSNPWSDPAQGASTPRRLELLGNAGRESEWAQLAAQQFWKPSPNFKLHVYLKDQTRPLQHIEVIGGGHDWFGHTSNPAGCTIDATIVISNFFKIPLVNYKSPVVSETPKLPFVSSSP